MHFVILNDKLYFCKVKTIYFYLVLCLVMLATKFINKKKYNNEQKNESGSTFRNAVRK